MTANADSQIGPINKEKLVRNMLFDEATQTYNGILAPYPFNDELMIQTFLGINKPLPTNSSWTLDLQLQAAEYYSSTLPTLPNSQWPWINSQWVDLNQTTYQLFNSTEHSLQQLINAMAIFPMAPNMNKWSGSLDQATLAPAEIHDPLPFGF
ncbi:hypothetical protein LJR189_004859 [Acidovorax delafieldii]|uniref:hypothetical protein n=1 Tax=Acidovorax delafieldii TaxID=47920 RepID=UPI003ED06A1A